MQNNNLPVLFSGIIALASVKSAAANQSHTFAMIIATRRLRANQVTFIVLILDTYENFQFGRWVGSVDGLSFVGG
jgi:hypothetical protein